MGRLKVLFFAEGATLAHVARPLLLAKELDLERFDVVLCRPEGFAKLTVGLPFSVIDLECQEGRVFARKLERGLPLYDFETLSGYVAADLNLIDRERPDVVIGDFRLSLSISARISKTPYITVCDAYWSPERALVPRLPVMGFTRFAPIRPSEYIFRHIAPLVFRLHAWPLERLRAKYRLPSLGYDLRRCYTDADLRLFANFPALFPEVRPHSGADFIGPIAWSPEFEGDLEFPPGDGPIVYVTMGSSGDARILGNIISLLEDLGSRIVVTTAGKPLAYEPNRPSTRVFDFLPGSAVCRHASLVVCNGGSPTTNQALRCGVPVLGIAQNMDQFLNMQAIEAFGAGVLLRSDRVSDHSLRCAVQTLFGDVRFAERARLLVQSLAGGLPKMGDFIEQAISSGPAVIRCAIPAGSVLGGRV